MSVYRLMLASLVAAFLASPVFADNATTSGEATETTQAVPALKVNLNTATAKDLMKVKGLNASRARAIVVYRKKHGDFKSTQDLTNVKGFKKMKPDAFMQIANQVTVQ
jgi:competence protein ComEA